MLHWFIIAPLTFFEVEFKVLLHSIELREAALGEAPEGFDTVDMNALAGEMLALVDAKVFIVSDIDKAIIAAPAIRMDDAFRAYSASNNSLQGLGSAICNQLCIDPAMAFIDAKDRLLQCPPASFPGTGAATYSCGAKEAFVDFNVRKARKYRLTVFRFSPNNWAVLVASISMQKHSIIFLIR